MGLNSAYNYLLWLECMILLCSVRWPPEVLMAVMVFSRVCVFKNKTPLDCWLHDTTNEHVGPTKKKGTETQAAGL